MDRNGMNRVLMQQHIEKMPITDRVSLFFFHWDTPALSDNEKEELEWRTREYTLCQKCNMFFEYILSSCCC